MVKCANCDAVISTESWPRTPLGRKAHEERSCVSCGQKVDLEVYFTVCPHCGFGYRIQVSPEAHGYDVALGTIAKAAFIMFIVAVVLLTVTLMLLS
jgi:DNA-directed RNA polymerase subunit RPC12/RpoP